MHPAPAKHVQEKRLLSWMLRRTDAEIPGHPEARHFPDRDDPLFFSLAHDFDGLGFRVEVVKIETDQLGPSDPGRVEQLQHGLVPDPFFRLCVRQLKKEADLFIIKYGLRQAQDSLGEGNA